MLCARGSVSNLPSTRPCHVGYRRRVVHHSCADRSRAHTGRATVPGAAHRHLVPPVLQVGGERASVLRWWVTLVAQGVTVHPLSAGGREEASRSSMTLAAVEQATTS